MYNTLPQELKDKALFCLWKYELNEKGKLTKVLYQTNGHHASSTNRKTFTTFTKALALLPKYDGIGFGIYDGFCAVDIDGCVKDGELSAMAKDIIERLKSYTEYSPSGTGIHIFFKVKDVYYKKERYYINNQKKHLEVYVSGYTNKFITLTGNALNSYGIEDCSEKLIPLLDKYMVKPTIERSVPKTTAISYLSDESVITKAKQSKQAEKFNSLWNGELGGLSSHSEADLSLCSILAFWCGGDMEQMDRLFRKSGLMREKWERNDYRNNTLKKAVSGVTDFYSPIPTTTAKEDFLTEKIQTDKYPWTEIGAGMLFADYCKDFLRYSPERKMWYYYKNGIWNADIGKLKAMKECMNLAGKLFNSALKIVDEVNRKAFMRYVTKWQGHNYRTNILCDAETYYPLYISDFDANPNLFNCNNGTLHLDTMDFTEHKSSDLLTKITDTKYDPSAVSERWNSFITEITSGDIDCAKFLQKILGYALSGNTRYECMTILYGATTRNGKGTLCESVLRVFGAYGCTARPETIAVKGNPNSSQPSEDIARLAGVRFVNIAEPNKGLILNAAQLKSMTGNDTLNARFLHENSFDFRPQFKLYVNTNYLPVVNDMTVFTSGRIIIIPFLRHFDESEQDKTLKEEFAKSNTQSAILNWLIEGYRLLQKEGLQIPSSVSQATDCYKHDSDKTALFIEECMEQGDYEERTSTVYERYRMWCEENGHFAESMKNFRQSLSIIATLKRKRPKSGGEKTTVMEGYRLVSDFLK